MFAALRGLDKLNRAASVVKLQHPPANLTELIGRGCEPFRTVQLSHLHDYLKFSEMLVGRSSFCGYSSLFNKFPTGSPASLLLPSTFPFVLPVREHFFTSTESQGKSRDSDADSQHINMMYQLALKHYAEDFVHQTWRVFTLQKTLEAMKETLDELQLVFAGRCALRNAQLGALALHSMVSPGAAEPDPSLVTQSSEPNPTALPKTSLQHVDLLLSVICANVFAADFHSVLLTLSSIKMLRGASTSDAHTEAVEKLLDRAAHLLPGAPPRDMLALLCLGRQLGSSQYLPLFQSAVEVLVKPGQTSAWLTDKQVVLHVLVLLADLAERAGGHNVTILMRADVSKLTAALASFDTELLTTPELCTVLQCLWPICAKLDVETDTARAFATALYTRLPALSITEAVEAVRKLHRPAVTPEWMHAVLNAAALKLLHPPAEMFSYLRGESPQNTSNLGSTSPPAFPTLHDYTFLLQAYDKWELHSAARRFTFLAETLIERTQHTWDLPQLVRLMHTVADATQGFARDSAAAVALAGKLVKLARGKVNEMSAEDVTALLSTLSKVRYIPSSDFAKELWAHVDSRLKDYDAVGLSKMMMSFGDLQLDGEEWLVEKVTVRIIRLLNDSDTPGAAADYVYGLAMLGRIQHRDLGIVEYFCSPKKAKLSVPSLNRVYVAYHACRVNSDEAGTQSAGNSQLYRLAQRAWEESAKRKRHSEMRDMVDELLQEVGLLAWPRVVTESGFVVDFVVRVGGVEYGVFYANRYGLSSNRPFRVLGRRLLQYVLAKSIVQKVVVIPFHIWHMTREHRLKYVRELFGLQRDVEWWA